MAGLGNERRNELNAPAPAAGGDLAVAVETWPIRGGFTISRGAKHEAVVVVASLSDGRHKGRGECVPYARYGESIEAVVSAIAACAEPLAGGLTRADLASLLPAGAARNALDCALWDLEAKRAREPAATLAGMGALQPVLTAFTLSLAPPDAMAARAREASAAHPLLKLKLGGDGDTDRLAAVRAAVPQARLIVDANEAWQPNDVESLLAAAAIVRFFLAHARIATLLTDYDRLHALAGLHYAL